MRVSPDRIEVPVHQIAGADWDDVQNINVRGTFLCCKAVLPTMIARRSGKIINISGTSGLRGYTQPRGVFIIKVGCARPDAYARSGGGTLQHQRQRGLPRGSGRRTHGGHRCRKGPSMGLDAARGL